MVTRTHIRLEYRKKMEFAVSVFTPQQTKNWNNFDWTFLLCKSASLFHTFTWILCSLQFFLSHFCLQFYRAISSFILLFFCLFYILKLQKNIQIRTRTVFLFLFMKALYLLSIFVVWTLFTNKFSFTIYSSMNFRIGYLCDISTSFPFFSAALRGFIWTFDFFSLFGDSYRRKKTD